MQRATLEEIYKSSLKFLSPKSLNEAYANILAEAMQLVKADSGVIHLKKARGFSVVYASQSSFYSIRPRKEGNVYKAFITGKPILAEFSDFGPSHPEFSDMAIKSAIFIPLSDPTYRTTGVLVLNSKRRNRFTRKELSILKLYGSMANLAIIKSKLYDETKKALAIRDSFISMTAHEIRTPATTIFGYAQLLRSTRDDSNTKEGRWIEQLCLEVSRLSSLVNDLLEVSRIKRGHFNYVYKLCDLKEIVARGIQSLNLSQPEREIIFKMGPNGRDCLVTGDSDKLLQVVINLLDNAVKFSPKQTKIVVGLESGGRNIYLTIKDQGIGISKKDLSRVFEESFRGRGLAEEGMGLGLYLAKNIVEKHRGKISIQSEEGKGTAVAISLPKYKL